MNIYLMKKPKRVNTVSVTMAIGAVVLGYLLYWWVPILWPMFRIVGIMKAACNEAYKNLDDQDVLKKLVRDAALTRLPLSEDNFIFTRVQYEQQELRDSKYEADSFVARRGKRCQIEFRYIADYEIPFTGQTMNLQFDRSVDAPLTTVEYKTFDYNNCSCVRVPRPGTR